VADSTDSDRPDLPAGDFSAWLRATRIALAGEGDAHVPCGTCTACCTSSQFVHLAPDETDTLARIPRALLFPAPGLPPGHRVLGYDEQGRCPMLVDGACSIYDHRPRTCRTYDCRVFPAAGIVPDEPTKVAIADRARRWRFDHPTPRDRAEHDAVRAAATSLEVHPELAADGLLPADTTGRAVAAVALSDLFSDLEEGDEPSVTLVREALVERRRRV
jgi:Fe-S-cluster containining protein